MMSHSKLSYLHYMWLHSCIWSGQGFLKRKTITHAIHTTAITVETVTNDFLIASDFAISVLQPSKDGLVDFPVSGTKNHDFIMSNRKKINIKSTSDFVMKLSSAYNTVLKDLPLKRQKYNY